MKKLPSQEEIQEISLETGIEAAFIEKDWFAVQLVALVSGYRSDQNVEINFSGDTSLSKGYQLIERFSEDLDFSFRTPSGQALSQGERRTFRRKLLDYLFLQTIVLRSTMPKCNGEMVIAFSRHRLPISGYLSRVH